MSPEEGSEGGAVHSSMGRAVPPSHDPFPSNFLILPSALLTFSHKFVREVACLAMSSKASTMTEPLFSIEVRAKIEQALGNEERAKVYRKKEALLKQQ